MVELDNVIVGRPRPKRHAIIVRHEVGLAPKRACSPVFPEGKTYGAQVRRDPESAGEVVLSWRGHVPSKASLTRNNKKFISMNIKAVNAKCITPKHITSFRRELHKSRPNSCSPQRLPHSLQPQGLKLPDSFAFGTSTKKGVSVGDLISHKFASDWVTAQTTLQEKRETKLKNEVEQRERRRENALAHLMGNHSISQHRGLDLSDPLTRFTLRRFRNIPGRTDCARPQSSLL